MPLLAFALKHVPQRGCASSPTGFLTLHNGDHLNKQTRSGEFLVWCHWTDISTSCRWCHFGLIGSWPSSQWGPQPQSLMWTSRESSFPNWRWVSLQGGWSCTEWWKSSTAGGKKNPSSFFYRLKGASWADMDTWTPPFEDVGTATWMETEDVLKAYEVDLLFTLVFIFTYKAPAYSFKGAIYNIWPKLRFEC